MDLHDLEALARAFLEEQRATLDDPPTAFVLARRWLGPGAVMRPLAMVAALSDTRPVHGVARIFVKASLPDTYANFYVGHELGHLLLRRAGAALEEVEEERAADYIAACLIMTRELVVAVYRDEGVDPKALAEAACVTQTAAVLRIGEVLAMPLAAVSPNDVRVRGPESFVWGTAEQIRREANARRLRPGLARVRLTDQPRRVALLADEDEMDCPPSSREVG